MGATRRPFSGGSWLDPVVSTFPLQASGRQLLTASGQQFYINGTSLWNGIVQATSAEVDTIIAGLQARSVNTVLMQLIGMMGDDPPEAHGAVGTPLPFTGAYWSTPNSTYFTWAATVLQKFEDAGMLVLLAPAYPGWSGASPAQGFRSDIASASEATLTAYGEYVGQWGAGFSNIVWVLGGDNTENLAKQCAVMEGVVTHASQLVCAHWTNGNNGTDLIASESRIGSLIDVDTVYKGNGQSQKAKEAYDRTSPSRPTFTIEVGYIFNTGTPSIDPQNCREWFWSPILSGATHGAISGNSKFWQVGGSYPEFNPGADWEAELDNDAFWGMHEVAGSIFATMPVLIPDHGTSGLITAGRNSIGSDGYVPAAKNSASTYALIFMPNAASSITVDKSEMSGTFTATWIDPTSGATVSGGSHSNSGTQSFSRGTANAAGDPDWLLKLEV